MSKRLLHGKHYERGSLRSGTRRLLFNRNRSKNLMRRWQVVATWWNRCYSMHELSCWILLSLRSKNSLWNWQMVSSRQHRCNRLYCRILLPRCRYNPFADLSSGNLLSCRSISLIKRARWILYTSANDRYKLSGDKMQSRILLPRRVNRTNR